MGDMQWDSFTKRRKDIVKFYSHIIIEPTAVELCTSSKQAPYPGLGVRAV